jgi:uncharacterized repeat protein (TIGR01451 family)
MAVESCTITQSGATNNAYVNQSISQSVPISPPGTTQSGKQTVNITQGPASVLNLVQIQQNSNQSLKTSNPTQTQVAGQSINVEQTANGTGVNSSSINQTQLQKEYARGTTQNQNVTTTISDCNPNTVLTPGPTEPNACAVVLQHSHAGNNTNALRQNVLQDMNSTGQSTQTQGAPDGGIDARVHQDTDTGTSTNNASLAKLQHETAAAGSTQTQHDPMSCCGFASQDGGANNTENINLTSSESASGDSSPDQTSDVIGTSHTPDGTCTIMVKASINGDSANNSDTESPCPFLTLQASCNDDGCSAPPPDLSNPNPPESSIVKFVRPTGCDCSLDHEASITGGGGVDYEIQYQNAGTGDAHHVTVSDPLPEGVSYVSDSCSGGNSCSFDSQTDTVTWDLGTVSPNADTIFLDFQATVPDETADIVNTPNVTSDEETTPIPGSPATVHDTAAPASAVTIGVRNITAGEQSFSPSTVATPGDVIEFQVVYSNTGGGSATNVSGTAPVPANVAGPPVNMNCPNTCNVNFDPTSGLPTSVSWSLGTVAPNTGSQFTTVTFNMVADFCPAFFEVPTVTTTEEGAVPVTPAVGAQVIPAPNTCIG